MRRDVIDYDVRSLERQADTHAGHISQPLWGWYHDAGDWDGHSHHSIVPRYLLLAYELAPQNLIDGELNIPESGNDLPDILDEAAWLIQYYRRSRRLTWLPLFARPSAKE